MARQCIQGRKVCGSPSFRPPPGLFDSSRGLFILLAARLHKMFLATINKPKQLLYMSFIHHVRAEEMKEARENVSLLLAELAPGFRLLTDLERLNTLDQECTAEIRYVMDLCNEKGIGMVVRVIP